MRVHRVMDRSCYFGFGFDRAIPAISLARETPRSFQFVGLDTLRRQGYAPQPGLYSDRKVSTRIYIYINVWRKIRGRGDLMGIRPVDDFDETFDSKLAGDSINFSDFLF